MKQNIDLQFVEILEIIKAVTDGQQQILNEIKEMRMEQKRLEEEVKLSNFVLNNMTMRSEILN